jgi:amino acid transporter
MQLYSTNMVRPVSISHVKITFAPLTMLAVVSQFFQDKGTSEVNPLVRYGAILSVAVALTAVNYRGLNTVGRTSILMYVLTMSPFLIMVIVGLSKGGLIMPVQELFTLC